MESVEQIGIELGFKSENFESAVKSANKVLKNIDKEFKNAVKGIDNFENSYVGVGAKIDMFSKKLDVNKQKLEAQQKSYDSLNQTLISQKQKLEELKNSVGENSDEWKKQAELVAKNSNKLQDLKSNINSTTKEIKRLEEGLQNSKNQFENLGNSVQSIDKKLNEIEESAKLTRSQFELLSSSFEDGSPEKLANEIKRLNSEIKTSTNKAKLYENEIKDLEKQNETLKNSQKDLTKEIEKVSKEFESAKNEFGETSKEAKELGNKLNSLKDDFNKIDKEINSNTKELKRYQVELNQTQTKVNNLGQELSEMQNNDSSSKFGDGLKDIMGDLGETGNIAKMVGSALVAMFTGSVLDAVNTYDNALLNLQQKMGATTDEANVMMKEINRIAGNGYSLDGITNGVILLNQQFENLTDGQVAKLSKDLEVLNMMGYEMNDVVRFLTSATNDWGMTHTQALDLIVAGEQKGLNLAGDWLDTLLEYTPILADMEISSDEFFAVIESGVKATGTTTDTVADMMKEFFLTITDGSDATKDAFAKVNIDVDELKEKIDSGAITSFEAFQMVVKGISNLEEGTVEAQAMAEIFKGTWEKATSGLMEDWANIDSTIVDTTGSMEQVRQAYESSYQAMQQDLTSEWEELKALLGAEMLPIVINFVDGLTKSIETAQNAPELLILGFQRMNLEIKKALEGAQGGFVEFFMGIGENISNFLDMLGFDGLAEGMRNNFVNPLKQVHDEVVDNIRNFEKELESNRDKTNDIIEGIWGENYKETRFKVDIEVEGEEEINSTQESLENLPEEKNINVDAEIDEAKNKVEEINNIVEEVSTKKIDADTTNAVQEIENLKNEADNTQSTIKVEVEKENVTNSTNEIKAQAKEVDGTNPTVTYHAETAQASKNITGLKKNADDYDSKHTGKTKKTTYHAETAQASKNVTGLKKNLSELVSKYARNFKTTFDVITKYSTVGTPTQQSRIVKTPKVITQNVEENNPNLRTPLNNINEEVSTFRKSPLGMDYFNLDVNPFEDLEKALKEINNQLGILDKKSDLAFGNEKANLLQNQVELLRKQQNIQRNLNDDAKEYANELEYFLSQNGVKFDDNNQIINQQEKLLEIEKEINKLENSKPSKEKLELKKASANATKEEKEAIALENEEIKKQNELNAKVNEEVSKSIENKKVQLEKVKSAISEYGNVTNNTLHNASEEWLELEKKIRDTQIAILEAKQEQHNFNIKIDIDSTNANIMDLENQMKILDREIEKAFGQDKINLINKKNALIKEQQQEVHKLAESHRAEAKYLQDFLNSKGFVFDKSGDLLNYDHLKDLKDLDSFEYIKESLESYINLSKSEVPKLSEDWWHLQEEVEKSNDEIVDIKDELKDLAEMEVKLEIEVDTTKANMAINNIKNQISDIDRLIDKADGTDKVGHINSKNDLISEQQKEQQKLIDSAKKEAELLSKELNNLGFIFHADGELGNYEFIEELKDNANFDDIKDSLDEYVKLSNSTIPSLTQDWKELGYAIEDNKDLINDLYEEEKRKAEEIAKEKAEEEKKRLEELRELEEKRAEEEKKRIEELKRAEEERRRKEKEALEDKLSTTKNIEDKITQMYEDQVDKRIELIDKELEKKLDALNKEKEAYNKSRAEADYKDNYDEQLNKVLEIQKKLDILAKDTSLSGQKKYKDLLKELKDEQKNLEDLVQDKIDSDVNDLFDSESDRLTENSNQVIEDLKEEFSKENIAQMVADALGSGIFTDIEGNVTSLQSAIIDFADESGDLFGVLGSTIKNDLIENLKTAVGTFNDLDNILNRLNSLSTSTVSVETNFNERMRGLDYKSEIYQPSKTKSKSLDNTKVSKNIDINFNSELIKIEGKVDDNVLNKLDSITNSIKDKILDEIVRAMR